VSFFLQVPKLCTNRDQILLYILILGTYSKCVWKNKMLALGICLPQACSSAGRRFAASRSRLHYYRLFFVFVYYNRHTVYPPSTSGTLTDGAQ